MTPSLLFAQPIAEGYLETSADKKLVWREFRWNTGKTSKMWFVDPKDIDEGQVEVCSLKQTKSCSDRRQYRNHSE